MGAAVKTEARTDRLGEKETEEMNRKWKCTIAGLFAALCLFVLGAAASAGGYISEYGNVYGTCKRLHNRTVIVSVFASDTATSWNWGSNADVNQYYEVYNRVKVAVEWIRK